MRKLLCLFQRLYSLSGYNLPKYIIHYLHIFLMLAIETKVPAQAKDTVVEKSEAMKDTAIEKGT